jgi:cation:H+ antiporter
MDIVYLVVGLGLLFLGGESLLRGSVAIAKKFKLSTLFVSMVLVGFGTSAPEFMVSVAAATQGVPTIALGNVIGSNIANILLILGLSAIIMPVMCRRKEMMRDTFAVLIASLVLAGLALHGSVGRLAGLLMLALLIVYIIYAYRSQRAKTQTDAEYRDHIEADVGGPMGSIYVSVLIVIAGFFLLAGGAYLLVEGATSIATRLGVSDAVIGLTIVAVGTSLPELATAAVAAVRKHSDVVIGNVIGSNLFNILGVLGATAAVSSVPFEGRLAQFDIWVTLAVAVALVPLVWTGRKIGRGYGFVFLSLYIIYLVWTYAASV